MGTVTWGEALGDVTSLNEANVFPNCNLFLSKNEGNWEILVSEGQMETLGIRNSLVGKCVIAVRRLTKLSGPWDPKMGTDIQAGYFSAF